MARWLSIHASYACRHRGACCGAGWPLPVERAVVPAIAAALSGGRLRTADGTPGWMTPHEAAPGEMAGLLRLLPDGHCVFHQPAAGGSRTCAVHGALGHACLPATCQHFPRVCLVDARGVHVTLSHFCPTAADRLADEAGAVSVVEGPPPVPGRDVPEGLDARDALPPLLAPGVLMDLEGYDAWERHVIGALAGPTPLGRSATDAVAHLVLHATTLRSWRPGRTTLAEAVDALGTSTRLARDVSEDAAPVDLDADLARFDAARAACAPPWTWPSAPDQAAAVDAAWVAPRWEAFDALVRRYLAAHAFASWVPWYADGTRALVQAVARALAVLRVEAIRQTAAAGAPLDRRLLVEAARQADLLLRHYADPAQLARA